VLGGVKDIREAVEQAQARARSGLPGSAHHRLRRRGAPLQQGQQDAFLPHVESGLFTFIGATTENPSFEVNSALLSRATVHVLQPLGERRPAALIVAERQAKRGASYRKRSARSVDRLCRWRRAAPAQHAGDAGRPAPKSLAHHDPWLLRCWASAAPLRQGRRAVLRHHQRPAQVVRGSDPDAALYWLVRMLDGGADPRYMARRLVRMASEDIGLADPRACAWRWMPPRCTSAWAARGRTGAGRRRGLPGGGAQEQCRVQGLQRRRGLMEILLQQIINGLVLGSMYAWWQIIWATPWCTASSTSSTLPTARC
jgi:putative ATPase